MAWEDDRNVTNNDNNIDIYGTRFDGYGLPIDLTGIPICATNGPQENPAVCQNVSSGETEWFVTWMDRRTTNDSDIYGARIVNNRVLDTNGFAIATGSVYQTYPAVYGLASGFLVAWFQGGNDIYGARVTSAGSVLDSAGFAINNYTNTQRNPRITGINDMYFVVYFSAQRAGISDYDIFGTRVTTNGSVLDATGIPICTATGQQAYPSVATDGSNFFAVWRDSRSTNWNIYGAFIQTNGTVLNTNGFVVADQPGNQEIPSVAYGASTSTFMVAWHHNNGNGPDIYGAFVTNSTSIGSYFAIDNGENSQTEPSVASDGTTFLTAYTSGRTGPPTRIRARLITP